MNIVRAFWIGLQRRWRVGFAKAFATIGVVWLLVEFSSALYRPIKTAAEWAGGWVLLAALSLAAVVFLVAVYERSSVRFKVANTSTFITLKFGDLLAEPENILFAVNEFFDGRLGNVVSPKSLHGQFIQQFFSSDEAGFRAAVDQELTQYQGRQTPRAYEPSTAYPLGTTIDLHVQGRSIFLFALTETDLVTAKARATVPGLWSSLCRALRRVNEVGNGRSLALPMIGGGQSGLHLDPQHLLRLVVLAVVDFCRREGLPRDVAIVLPQGCFEELDIHEIARDWRRA